MNNNNGNIVPVAGNFKFCGNLSSSFCCVLLFPSVRHRQSNPPVQSVYIGDFLTRPAVTQATGNF